MGGDRGACWRCRWFEPDPDADDEGGFCVRRPPQMFVTDDEIVSAWPGVEPLGRCGEFEEEEDAR